MSLTNDQITAQNFKTFYEGIRPYLNGSFPTPIANKFSKGDLYSTDEKLIGQWIDGKPLYQKVIDCGALPNNSTKLVDISDLGIDLCISMEGLTYNSSYSYTIPKVSTGSHIAEFWIDRSTSKINIRTTSNESTYDHTYAIIQYTKTSDSPIEIGSDMDYSLNEKIVGTWLNGKPIYQKTVIWNSSNNTIPYDEFSENIDEAVDLKFRCGWLYNGETMQFFTSSYKNENNTLRIGVSPTNRWVNIMPGSYFNNKEIIVTLFYTKTTDTATVQI